MTVRLFFAATAILALSMSGASAAPSGQAEFVTLGTAGGPLVRAERSEPANAVVINGAVYLFDVGDGVQRRLAAAKLPLAQLRAIFISHHHVDHNAGLAPLLVTRWLTLMQPPLPVIGPPGTSKMLSDLSTGFRPIELAPITIGGPPKPPIAASFQANDMPRETPEPVVAYKDENIHVLAITNAHYHFAPGSEEQRFSRSYAFRIETPGRVIVFTGDTGPSRDVERLARGADLLVSEVIDLSAMRRLLSRLPGPPAPRAGLLAHLEQDHLTRRRSGIWRRPRV